MAVLSQRIQKVKPSATLQITAKAKELRAQGKNVIGLGAGEPDFDTPEHIKEAAITALREGFTKYTPVDGIPELKKAIIGKMQRDNNLSYALNEVLVTSGGKQAFFNMALAMLNPGDEVIIPAPYWVSYPDMTLVADGQPVIVDTEEREGFKLNADRLAAAITAKTRFVVINSPSNPTGAAYTAEEMIKIAEVLRQHPWVWVVSDDIYEQIVYDGFRHTNILQVAPFLKDRTLILNGVSKTYSMTGWRIGYAVGPSDAIKAMGKVQEQSTSCSTSIAQRAAAVAIAGDQSCIQPMVRSFLERRNFVVSALNAIPGIHCNTPEGSFYVFPNVSGLIGKKTPKGAIINNSMDLADHLLNDHDVALVPGSAFGKDHFVRISFAISMNDLKEAMIRIERAARALA
ncbi:MAG: pyridoxal phosphate-dependent aminotransferase [Magnetococcales bacterium]|nr:pyridoxal phosphate-dependent aminotransferase [Magnetococcales bacterium]MBF0148764.1 pyridoxal phosphate-dependent aminotransferase [Magnetococcales bacterium]MBF0174205.1 pyridoxal phosphate-dependent aminotransferase [Magnetococcales bacterium]MBF0348101.1 pyridoxal phosphate-dependent aminotransferase [Magnetococcales bacterium]MBF0629594.1 pyridoxal phosphate-dependent aminotransferase [Magnetococcales bacterium]